MQTNLDTTRRQLTAARAQLAERLGRIRRDSIHGRQPLSADSADRAQERENDEVMVKLDASTEGLLEQYDRALAQLEAGRYGVCETCGYPIEPVRLTVQPAATQCASCAGAGG